MSAPAVPPPSGRITRLSVLGVTVLVFGAAVAVMTQQLRVGLREQILRREAEMLAAIASMQLDDAAEDVPAAMFVAVLKTQKLAGVSGLRIYDGERRLNGTYLLPPAATPPPEGVWRRVAAGESVGRLHRNLSRDPDAEIIPVSATDAAFEAWVPLRRNRSAAVIGAAQFWFEADQLFAELGAHDRRLWTQALIAWLAGALVIVTTLSWAFRRLDAANATLRARSEDLQRANRELVLAAKTSALGAVTAHLMHEIKNPLAGLESIVRAQTEAVGLDVGRESELAEASELTRRLRTMVNDVVAVLRDEQTGAEFELTGADVADVVREKVQPEADARGLRVEAAVPADFSLPGRRANLVTLVLRNLVQNALEATPAGGRVRIQGNKLPVGGFEFVVEDEGGGLPDAVRERLFQPCPSTKVGGSGLGLALSQRLASQAGGRIELVRSDPRGTSFRLVLEPEA
jgi:signal transduction histidine kinase